MPTPDYFKNQVSSWTNAHLVFEQAIQGIYDLHNQNPDDPTQTLPDYLSQVSQIQGLIQDLMGQGVRARALGAGWSFSKVGATDGYLLNQQFLKNWFPMGPTYVNPGVDASNFFLFQCGMSVHDVHMALLPKGKSLPVSGSSCGQSLIGAFTTGTHGSHFSGGPGTGALQDAIRGLHLIVGPNRQVWLEPKSRPIVTDAFLAKLQINKANDLIQDDDMFYSALNSLGGFGVIHGTLLEAVDLFRLDLYRQFCDYASLEGAMTSFDFTGVDIGGFSPGELYHFEVMNNIYATDKGKSAILTVAAPTQLTTPPITAAVSPPGEAIVGLWAQVTNAASVLVPTAMNTFFNGNYPPINHQRGTLVEMNPYITNVGPGSIVCSIAMDMADCRKAMQICQTLNNSNIACWYEFRFIPRVNGPSKVMGFQRFDHTCIFEIAGLGSANILKYINDCLVQMEASGIAFTLHWGKYLPVDAAQTKYGYPQADLQYKLTPAKLAQMYQEGARDNVAIWKAKRSALFNGDPKLMDFFSNELTQKLGLA